MKTKNRIKINKEKSRTEEVTPGGRERKREKINKKRIVLKTKNIYIPPRKLIAKTINQLNDAKKTTTPNDKKNKSKTQKSKQQQTERRGEKIEE